MKGTGGAYGCAELGEIGGRVEAAARQRNAAAVGAGIQEIAEFVSNVEIAVAGGAIAPPAENLEGVGT